MSAGRKADTQPPSATVEADRPLSAAVEAGPASSSAARRPTPLDSRLLFAGQRLVEIVHNGEIYRLQATRLGKLILTK